MKVTILMAENKSLYMETRIGGTKYCLPLSGDETVTGETIEVDVLFISAVLMKKERVLIVCRDLDYETFDEVFDCSYSFTDENELSYDEKLWLVVNLDKLREAILRFINKRIPHWNNPSLLL